MMCRQWKRLLSFVLAMMMVVSLLPATGLTVSAVEEIRPEVKWGAYKRIQFTLDSSGVLTWSEVPGATSYELIIRLDGDLFKDELGLKSTSYDLVGNLNQYKMDSGTVSVYVSPKGVQAGNTDQVNFLYSSPYPKLEAPANLKWDAYGNADWDDVANADGYTLYLYQPSGGAYNHYDLANSYFNCTDYPDVATRISDGWYFAVRAKISGS